MNEELVQEPVTDVTENTEAQTVEKIEEGIELTDTASREEKKEVKEYTEEEIEKLVNDRVNTILPTKIAREKRKIEKDYREKMAKYEETESILKAGLGTNDIVESNKKMREYYEEQGIQIPVYAKPKYSENEERILGEAEADEIINSGYEEMRDEARKLSEKGFENLTEREKIILGKIGSELTYEDNRRELARMGVKEEVLNDSNFKKFASQFNTKTPVKTVYEMYAKIYQPKPKVEQIGSMKSLGKEMVKEHYTAEEIEKLTDEELDNPKVWEAVRRSMTGQS